MSELSVLEAPRKRRRFTAEFKASVVEACQQPGASVAGIALEHALNANLVHKWIREARRMVTVSAPPAFVPVPMTSTTTLTSTPHQEAEPIRLSLPSPKGTVTIEWPLSDAQGCRALLRDLLS
ncbi:transposase [Halomonas sp. SH5A2]|uniref:IS66-like element accessory protein TnpA n=1 Tax=Halomonas sp. SH5A2 TaxID=2749040 RepID=UPI001640FD24|nr:transposase [Halomonas sp. SH5A2]QNI02384.1 transposase [Halomonas sp. SH5A2]QNI03063.1 transposase [Halomonas sp. SH5A2]QNI03589.1 transposase [Halomonas sp. SH5A2]QNI04086.1 transposase [Halomonas sp. SH5A2]